MPSGAISGVAREAARVVALRPDDVILDAGTGCGHMTRTLMKEYVFKEYIGFDVHAPSVSFVNTRVLQQSNSTSVPAVNCVSDLRSLQWIPDGSVSVVISHGVLMYLPLPQLCAAMHSLFLKLTPGGRMYLPFTPRPSGDAALDCLLNFPAPDVEFFVVMRSDAVYEAFYAKFGGVHLSSVYFEAPTFLITRRRSAVQGGAVSGLSFHKSLSAGDLVDIVVGTGAGIQFHPLNHTVAVWGGGCSPGDIRKGKRCVAAKERPMPGESPVVLQSCDDQHHVATECMQTLHEYARNHSLCYRYGHSLVARRQGLCFTPRSNGKALQRFLQLIDSLPAPEL